MKSDPKNFIKALAELDKKVGEIDEFLKDVRVDIHNLIWSLIAVEKEGKKRR